jgi:hypothetical protein
MARDDRQLPRILILGAGLGGTIAAYEIEEAVRGNASVQVISDSPVFSFVPSMTRAAAATSPVRPLDPRSRAVLSTVPLKPGTVELHLECGHALRRRVAFCAPARVICTLCPRAPGADEIGAAARGDEHPVKPRRPK